MSDNPKYLILEQSAHCDWDWNTTFDGYYTAGVGSSVAVSDILTTAMTTLLDNPPYVFCEVAYLQEFHAYGGMNTEWQRAITAGTFQFASGGITSAENLLLHTEAFVRNYLYGRQWLKATFQNAVPSLTMWIPDDFGHDAQLPALLQAMGFTGVGFARIPVTASAAAYGPGSTGCAVQIEGSAPQQFLPTADYGIDFIWQAADGSTIQAHWLSGGYGQGNQLGTTGTIDLTKSNAVIDSFTKAFPGQTPQTDYLFVPIDVDFKLPYSNLQQAIAQYNALSGNTVTVIQSTFADFMSKVAAEGTLNTVYASPAANQGEAFLPHPYYSGCYGSRMGIKQMHFQAVRSLLFAEALEMALEAYGFSVNDPRRVITDAWSVLMPSTHHDYITGTAPDPVTDGEQLAILEEVAGPAAENALSFIQDMIATNVDPGNALGNSPAIYFNPVALSRVGMVEVRIPSDYQFSSSTTDGAAYYPTQISATGTLLTLALLPPLGYQTAWLGTDDPNQKDLTLSITQTDDGFTLANEFLSADITAAGITALYDLTSGEPVQILDGTANELVVYEDSGSIYRFAFEVPCDTTMVFQQISAPMSMTLSQTESGPIRVTVTASGTMTVSDQVLDYEIVYSLVVGEPFLRITTTGTAPGYASGTGYSVMVRIPFGATAQLGYGTTAHHDQRTPRNFTNAQSTQQLETMTFEPTHEYVVAYDADGDALGAVYHFSTPGWAIAPDGVSLYGCILRNTPNSAYNGASGSDIYPHTNMYAIGIPGKLQSPLSGCGGGTPLGNALLCNNPITGMLLPEGSGTILPPSMSIAQTDGSTALVTVAKAGNYDPSDMIVRIYQPTNLTVAATVMIDPNVADLFNRSGALNAHAVTAIEEPMTNPPAVSSGQSAFTIDMPNAWATVALSR